MTIEEKIRQLKTDELSKFLFDFFIEFHNENITGLCDIACDSSIDSCNWCIKEWLSQNADTCELFQNKM